MCADVSLSLYLFIFLSHTSLPQIAKDDDVTRRVAQAKEAIHNYMPRAHLAVLELLLPFLADVCDHKDVNKMDEGNLGVVFGPTLMRSTSVCLWIMSFAWSCRVSHVLRHVCGNRTGQ